MRRIVDMLMEGSLAGLADALAANLGIATDLQIHLRGGVVEAVPPYLVVRTPDAPEYFFGNLLFLAKRPVESDLERLETDFERLVRRMPEIRHRTFVFPEVENGGDGLQRFVDAGYNATQCCVHVATPAEIRDVRLSRAIEIRAFRSHQDWDQWMRMQLEDVPPGADQTYHRFLVHQQNAYRRLIQLGLGHWWGAFLDGEQVASLGLFFFDGVARFQSVMTAAQYRNQNICKTLVREVIARTTNQVSQYVMVADESYHAGRIYESLGFRRHQWMGSLCLEPRAQD